MKWMLYEGNNVIIFHVNEIQKMIELKLHICEGNLIKTGFIKKYQYTIQ